jgi:AraC-like DNA-binding protein
MHIIIPGLQAMIAFQCMLFALYLILDRKLGVIANRINLGLLLVLATHMVFNLFNQHLTVGKLPDLAFGFGMFYGPLTYFYVRALIYKDFAWRAPYWLHFLPGLLLSVIPLWLHTSTLLGASLIFTSMAIYLALSYISLWRFQRVLLHTQSALDRIAMKWAGKILLLNAAGLFFNIVSVGRYVMFKAGQYSIGSSNELGDWAEVSLFLTLLIMVNAFIFKGLLQPELFEGITPEDEAITAQSMNASPVTEIDSERQLQIKAALMSHMQRNKPYLDPLFSLQSLGRQLGEPPRYVSQVINGHLQMNFSDFVNSYRINDVKHHLQDPQENRTILDIIYACGFSTKSNFNRAFKQQEGITPSEYRRTQQQSSDKIN